MDFLMQEIQTTEIKYKWSPFSTQPLTESITAEPGVQPASPCSTRLRRKSLLYMLPVFPSNRHICINSNCGILCHVNKHFLHTWVLCLVEEEKINILTRKTADSRPTLVKKKKIAAVTLSRTSTLSTPFLTKAMNLFTVNHLTPFPDAGETSVNTTSAACII